MLYYPQAVSPLMGPTAVVPGSQYSRAGRFAGGGWSRAGPTCGTPPPNVQANERHVITGQPGVCVFMHYHLWHRGTKQLGGAAVPPRFMFKFQFRRTRPFLPTPQALRGALGGPNPFLASEPAAAVWATLAGETLGVAHAAQLVGCAP